MKINVLSIILFTFLSTISLNYSINGNLNHLHQQTFTFKEKDQFNISLTMSSNLITTIFVKGKFTILKKKCTAYPCSTSVILPYDGVYTYSILVQKIDEVNPIISPSVNFYKNGNFLRGSTLSMKPFIKSVKLTLKPLTTYVFELFKKGKFDSSNQVKMSLKYYASSAELISATLSNEKAQFKYTTQNTNIKYDIEIQYANGLQNWMKIGGCRENCDFVFSVLEDSAQTSCEIDQFYTGSNCLSCSKISWSGHKENLNSGTKSSCICQGSYVWNGQDQLCCQSYHRDSCCYQGFVIQNHQCLRIIQVDIPNSNFNINKNAREGSTDSIISWSATNGYLRRMGSNLNPQLASTTAYVMLDTTNGNTQYYVQFSIVLESHYYLDYDYAFKGDSYRYNLQSYKYVVTIGSIVILDTPTTNANKGKIHFGFNAKKSPSGTRTYLSFKGQGTADNQSIGITNVRISNEF